MDIQSQKTNKWDRPMEMEETPTKRANGNLAGIRMVVSIVILQDSNFFNLDATKMVRPRAGKGRDRIHTLKEIRVK